MEVFAKRASADMVKYKEMIIKKKVRGCIKSEKE